MACEQVHLGRGKEEGREGEGGKMKGKKGGRREREEGRRWERYGIQFHDICHVASSRRRGKG